ncbi:tetratricopeptide repeat protein [Desulfococcaceae bacterium HSG8]|nr:tetratricopeptide repeat protein [Desulfococcaceae bacterium HSG8]
MKQLLIVDHEPDNRTPPADPGEDGIQDIHDMAAPDSADNLFPGDRNALNKDLADALKFYYENRFAEALPIFRRISRQVKTPDILFWLGTCGARTGDCGLAVEKLQEALEINPNLVGARMELAAACFHCGQYEKAKQEFEKIKADSPPPEVEQRIDRFLSEIKQDEERFTWKLRFVQAYQYDDNVTSGPGRTEIDDGSVSIIIDEESGKMGSGNWITDLKAGFLYDTGRPDGFLWNGGLNFFYNCALENSAFNYTDADGFAGLRWKGKQDIIRMPVGFSHKRYGGDALSDTLYFDPDIEHFITDFFSIKMSLRCAKETYADPGYSDAGYDNVSLRASSGPRFYLSDSHHVLSGFFTLEDRNADSDAMSYSSRNFSASYFASFMTRTELLLFYKWTDRQYSGSPNFYDAKRHDKRNTLTAIIGQRFRDHFFTSLELAYISNDSNAELYDFRKTACTVSAGITF